MRSIAKIEHVTVHESGEKGTRFVTGGRAEGHPDSVQKFQ